MKTGSIYSQIRAAVSQKSIHPLKASAIIARAIENGHNPPEIMPSTRASLVYLISRYIKRDMNKYALDEVTRCLARGHVDDYTLLHPIAEEYISCLISQMDVRKDTQYRPNIRARNLIVAAKFIAKLDHFQSANSISSKTYDRLIEKMQTCADNCNPAPVISIALKNKIPLNTSSWNVRLQCAARTSPTKVLQSFQQMTSNGVQSDKYTIAIVLNSLRKDATLFEKAHRIIDIAKHLDLYNEFVAVEEMSLWKRQGRYQDVLRTFADAFGPETLSQFGFQTQLGTTTTTTTSTARQYCLKVSKVSLSLMLDALVRLNTIPDHLEQLYQAYERFTKDKDEFLDDVHSPSIFIRAFANRTETLERAMELLEEMRAKGRKPTVVSYTNVIDGLTRHGMIDLATRVLQYMKNDGVKPNEYTWRILYKGYEHAGNKQAMDSAQRMIDEAQRKSATRVKRSN